MSPSLLGFSGLLRFLRFFPFFKESTTHVFEGQETRPGRLKIGADAPVIAQGSRQLKEVLATTAAIGSPIVRSAARPIRLEISWEPLAKLHNNQLWAILLPIRSSLPHRH